MLTLTIIATIFLGLWTFGRLQKACTDASTARRLGFLVAATGFGLIIALLWVLYAHQGV